MITGVVAVGKCAWAVVNVVGKVYGTVTSVKQARNTVQDVFKKNGE